MLGYNKTIEEFNQDVLDNNIVSSILQNIRAGGSEQGAWQDAAIYMKKILEKANLPKNIEIGMDLRYSNQKGVYTDYTTHPKTAGHFRRHGRREPLLEDLETIDMIIRNTYNVLLKRGIKGCYIYCEDKELSKHLKDLIKI